jgi:hypothetical protein
MTVAPLLLDAGMCGLSRFLKCMAELAEVGDQKDYGGRFCCSTHACENSGLRPH